MSKWKLAKLSGLCTRIGDGLHGTPEYLEDSEIYFINGNNLVNGLIEIDAETRTVSPSEFTKHFVKLDENSLLLSINGTLGNMAFYNREKIILGKSAAYLNFESRINRFYYYYFQLPDVQKYFYDVATGSTIKNLSLQSLQDFEVPVPDENEWEGIYKVLAGLDAKIELNRRINAELERLAKTIYDYWFVQFDFPDAHGRPYKSSGGKMTYNPTLKRQIPEGWEVGTLSDITKQVLRAYVSEIESDVPYIGLEHMPRRSISLWDWGTAAEVESQKSMFAEGEFLFGKLRPYFHKVGIAPVDGVCSTDILVLAPKFPEWFGFVLFTISTDEMIRYADATSGGTKMPRTSWQALARYPLAVPPESIGEKFNAAFLPCAKRLRLNILESRQLADLRDWLLPMLMNGQVTVKKIGQCL